MSLKSVLTAEPALGAVPGACFHLPANIQDHLGGGGGRSEVTSRMMGNPNKIRPQETISNFVLLVPPLIELSRIKR